MIKFSIIDNGIGMKVIYIINILYNAKMFIS